RLTKVTNDFGGPEQAEMSYGYDEVGNRISQTDPNLHVTKWVYDDLGRILN
ncbi:MAG: RHS repeat protein, partial [Desulfobacterales bacterium]|nr:RHS repeat protein [Desulfobacterales bacterium]